MIDKCECCGRSRYRYAKYFSSMERMVSLCINWVCCVHCYESDCECEGKPHEHGDRMEVFKSPLTVPANRGLNKHVAH